MPLPLRFSGSKKQETAAYSAVEIDPNRSESDVSRTVPGWPSGPQHPHVSTIWILADILLLLLPIAFIALAALAYKLDGKNLSEYGRHIEQVTLLSPTLFPLAFAALAGRSLKKIALWRAERGTTLGFLEHMIGSQSLVATVGHSLTLHSLNFLTIGLLFLWALSPLGGQSALRLISETNSTIVENRTLFYANVDAPSQFPSRSYNRDAASRVNAVVMGSLMSLDTTEKQPADAWNHPKIPRIEELEKAERSNAQERPWYTVDQKTDQTYASLTGVDVLNLPRTGSANLTIPYEYMYFGCDFAAANNFTMDPSSPFFKTPFYLSQIKWLRDLDNAKMLESAGQFNSNPNVTSIVPVSQSSGSIQDSRSFFIYTKGNATKPETLILGSRGFATNMYFLFECSMNSVMVESNIICDTDKCRVDRLRRLAKPRKERFGSHLPYDVINNGYTARYFIRHFVEMGGQNEPMSFNPIDEYIYGNQLWANYEWNGAPKMRNWSQYIDKPDKIVDMSHRLTSFINTYWDASRWPIAATRNDPFAQESLNSTTGEPLPGLTMNRTDTTVSRQVPIYRADPKWVAILVICSSVLLLLGIFSLVISLQTTVPDIFDYVSSFTRDNPFVNAPHGGSAIDGAERARLLRKLEIQLGDTQATSDVGYISIRSISGEEDRVAGRVKKERQYL